MPKLAIVLKGYPRLSETFIAQEILNLERSGFELTLISLRLPTDIHRHPIHEEITAPVIYLPEYLYRQPFRLLRGWWHSRRLAGYASARKQFFRDLVRDPTSSRVRRFGQALVLSAEFPSDIPAIYAHFLHTPSSVARYAAILLELPWAVSAHAKDIHTTPTWDISEKLAHCNWLTTCTRYNADILSRFTSPGKVMLNYHGLDLGRFACSPGSDSGRDGRDSGNPVRILSVGRAVEKKGYDGLLEALAGLPEEVAWTLTHIGGGPLLTSLKEQAVRLGIDRKIEWLGSQTQETVLSRYRDSDLFVLNSRIDQHGDRDGLPNVIVEAQSQGLPVIATDLSGIPELVEDGVSGILVPSGDHDALLEALQALIHHPEVRDRMGRMGQCRVSSHFAMEAAFQPLRDLLMELAWNDGQWKPYGSPEDPMAHSDN